MDVAAGDAGVGGDLNACRLTLQELVETGFRDVADGVATGRWRMLPAPMNFLILGAITGDDDIIQLPGAFFRNRIFVAASPRASMVCVS